MKSIILCGGLGERLGQLTFMKPKPMISVAGKPVLEHIIDHLNRYDIQNIIVNVHWRYPQIVEYFGPRLLFMYEPMLLGTAGTIKKLIPFMSDPFLVMNGDTMTNLDIHKMRMFHTKTATVSVKPSTLLCSGAMIFSKKIDEYLPHKGMIDDVLEHLKDKDYYEDPELVRFDIGTPEKLAVARRYYENTLHLP